MNKNKDIPDPGRKPAWLKKRLPLGGGVSRTEKLLRRKRLNTVCQGAKCPNKNDCYQGGTATFLILGDVCSRGCSFCSIPGRAPLPVDPTEPERIAAAAREMGLRYAVVTSVTRDDLADGGASHFAVVVGTLKKEIPRIGVELLVPDFNGSRDALSLVLDSGPTVLNHNVETVPALYPGVRPEADYSRSLELLSRASARKGIPVKSGFMLGLGEGRDEVIAMMGDLRRAGVDLLTIGQYLKPSDDCLNVVEYVKPDLFEELAAAARSMGFRGVASGPFVRSSYRAAELMWEADLEGVS